jgi:adenylate cyclase
LARLYVTAPGGRTGIYELTKPVISIGRGSANDLVLNSEKVSRFHAVVRRVGEQFVLADRGSTNGVEVNKKRVPGDATLVSDDVIQIGDYILRFENTVAKDLQIDRPDIPSTLNNVLRGGLVVESLSPNATVFPKRAEVAIGDGTTALRDRVQKLERENYLLQVLFDVGKALQSRHSIEEVTQEIVELAFRIQGVDRGFVMLIDGSGEITRQSEVRYRYPTSDAQPQIIFSRAVLDRMKSEMSPILITDLSADERFQGSESMKVSGLRSAMCAPLSAQNRLFGVLYVDNLQHTMAFTQDELNVFAVVASQAAAAIDNALAHSKIARQSLERAALERFLAPEVVELIAANPDKVRLGGANQEVSVLFADIRGFTSLSETLPPERIVEILNEYFTRVADVIFDHGGTLDKFLGDGLMAIFGAPISKGNDAANAVKAALSIQALMFELNRDAQARDWPELQVGIGVNTGIVTAGNIGSPKRIDYTVIGDAVNVSSRLCSNAKPGEVLISESTTAKVRGLFELKRLEPLQVKGKALPLNVFQVIAAARGTAGKL